MSRDVNWLPQLPQGWKVMSLRNVCDVGTGSRDTIEATDDGRYPFIVRSPKQLRIDDFTHDGEAVLTPGDGDVGEIFHHLKGKFAAHQRVYVLNNFRHVYGRYFFYYFSEHFRKVTSMGTAQSTVPSLRRPMFTSFPVVVPSSVEKQRKIAEFLDRETKKIDSLIEKERQLIVALRNRRIRVILSAITSGVRSDRDGNESGIHWSPNIPSEWRVMPLKRIFSSVQTGVWGEDPDGGQDDVPCVRVADFDRPRLRVGDSVETIRKVSVNDRRTKYLQRGDLLIEKSGGTGVNPVGFVAIYDRDVEAVCANFIVRMRVDEGQDSRFWMYALHASYASGLTWNYVKQTTGIQNLDLGAFLSERFPVPSLDEQCVITEYLDRETARIDTLIAKSGRLIELSQERRSALIIAAVTGQIDVRDMESGKEAA